MENKKGVLIGSIFMICAFLVMLFFLHGRDDATEPTPKAEEKEQEEYSVSVQKHYKYEHVESLWFLGTITREDFKTSVAAWLEEEQMDCSVIRVLSKIEEVIKDKEYAFYLQLDTNPDLIKGDYVIADRAFSYRMDGEHSDLAAMGGIDEKLNQSTEKGSSDSYRPEDASDAVGEVQLTNVEMLPDELSEKDIKEQLLAYLNQNQELRRNISIEEVREKDAVIEITFGFETPRIDRKHPEAVYDRETMTYQFSLTQ